MELNNGESEFTPEYPEHEWGDISPVDETLGREVASSYFKSFFKNDASARLANLEVRFICREIIGGGLNVDSKYPIRIRRLERDDAPSPVDGGFSVECEGRWLHEW